MSVFFVLFLLYFVGLPISLILGGKKSLTSMKMVIGTFGWIVASGILSYTKNLPTAPFMGLVWLPTSLVPLILVIPFYCYQVPRRYWAEIKHDLRVLLVLGILSLIIALLWKPTPTITFENQLKTVVNSSLIAPYQGINIVQREKIVNIGAELLVSYIGQPVHSTTKSYQYLLVILIVCLIQMLVEVLNKLRINLRTMIGVGFVMATLVMRLVVFSDVFNAVMVMMGWITLFQVIKAKHIILSGIILSGIFSINVGATLWWITPSLLFFRPKELGKSVITAVLINPLLIGSVR